MQVTIDVLGDVVISRRFVRVAGNAEDMSPAFDTIMDAFEDWTADQFATRGAAFGTRWDPLTDATIADKRRAGASEPEQPLVWTGALRASFQRGGKDHVRESSRDSAEWGTRNRDAMWHHGRHRSSSNPVPRRPIFELEEARRRWIMDVLHRRVFETGSLRGPSREDGMRSRAPSMSDVGGAESGFLNLFQVGGGIQRGASKQGGIP